VDTSAGPPLWERIALPFLPTSAKRRLLLRRLARYTEATDFVANFWQHMTLHRLALLEARVGNTEQAEAYANRALEAAKDDDDRHGALLLLIYLSKRAGRPRAAAAAFRQIASLTTVSDGIRENALRKAAELDPTG
jgi:hypothetical protein